jgi:hypothetical protein
MQEIDLYGDNTPRHSWNASPAANPCSPVRSLLVKPKWSSRALESFKERDGEDLMYIKDIA